MEHRVLFKNFPQAAEAKEISRKHLESRKIAELQGLITGLANSFNTGKEAVELSNEQLVMIKPFLAHLATMGYELVKNTLKMKQETK